MLFTAMTARIKSETVPYLYFLQVASHRPVMPLPEEETRTSPRSRGRAPNSETKPRSPCRTSLVTSRRRRNREMAELQSSAATEPSAPAAMIKGQKVGRNEPCLGSGKNPECLSA